MREQRKQLTGVVTSDKMDKTVVVEVATTRRHQLYGKVIRRVKKYKAHDEANECRLGDTVQIIESRPISRHKRWSVVNIIDRAA
jgi:small subunit ribosomal protein S17